MKIEPKNQLAIDKARLVKILREYDLELLGFSEASTGIENKTIITNTTSGKYVVRVYRHSNKTNQSISLELDFTRYLRAHNVPTPKIIKNTLGQSITNLSFNNRTWQIIVMEFVEGRHEKKYSNTLLAEMASIQADTHNLSKMYDVKDHSPEKITFLQETYFINKIDFKKIADNSLKDFLKRAENYALDLSPNLPRGLCHLDYDKENLLSDSGAVLAVLDFDDLADAPYVVCLAYTLWHIFVTEGQAAAQYYLRAYEHTRKLSRLEQKYLQQIMLFRHYMISALKVLNNHTSANDISSYLAVEKQLLAKVIL